MIVFLVASVVVVAGLAVGVTLGRLGGRVHLTAPTSSLGAIGLPDGPPRSVDVERVTFDRVVRGYRMDQVDEVLDRLHLRLAELEVQVATATHGGQSGPRAAALDRSTPVAPGAGGMREDGSWPADPDDEGHRTRRAVDLSQARAAEGAVTDERE